MKLEFNLLYYYLVIVIILKVQFP